MQISFKKLLPIIYLFIIIFSIALLYVGVDRNCHNGGGILDICIPGPAAWAILVSLPGAIILLPMFGLIAIILNNDLGLWVLIIGSFVLSLFLYFILGLLLDFWVNKFRSHVRQTLS